MMDNIIRKKKERRKDPVKKKRYNILQAHKELTEGRVQLEIISKPHFGHFNCRE